MHCTEKKTDISYSILKVTSPCKLSKSQVCTDVDAVPIKCFLTLSERDLNVFSQNAVKVARKVRLRKSQGLERGSNPD